MSGETTRTFIGIGVTIRDIDLVNELNERNCTLRKGTPVVMYAHPDLPSSTAMVVEPITPVGSAVTAYMDYHDIVLTDGDVSIILDHDDLGLPTTDKPQPAAGPSIRPEHTRPTVAILRDGLDDIASALNIVKDQVTKVRDRLTN